MGIETVNRHHQLGRDFVLDRTRQTQAFQPGGDIIAFQPAKHVRIGRRTTARIAPGAFFFGLIRLIDIGCRQRNPELVVHEFLDNRGIDPITKIIAVRVELASIGVNALHANRDDRITHIERADRPDVD